MRIIGVIDLLDGRAVHARAGARERYAPVERAAGVTFDVPGDALALAQTYVNRLGVSELYAADLNAILHGGGQEALIAQLSKLGAPVWLDSAVATLAGARRAKALGAARVVVGLETLPSFDSLRQMCGALDVVFSLDLRNGVPMVARDSDIGAAESAEAIALRAREAGTRAIVVIDLARVGTGSGVDLALLGRLRSLMPDVQLLAGGGVAGWDDLVRLADAGCDGALVATALHDGRIGRGHVAAAGQL